MKRMIVVILRCSTSDLLSDSQKNEVAEREREVHMMHFVCSKTIFYLLLVPHFTLEMNFHLIELSGVDINETVGALLVNRTIVHLIS